MSSNQEFVNLTEDGGVQKRIIQEGDGEYPSPGDQLVGTSMAHFME